MINIPLTEDEERWADITMINFRLKDLVEQFKILNITLKEMNNELKIFMRENENAPK